MTADDGRSKLQQQVRVEIDAGRGKSRMMESELAGSVSVKLVPAFAMGIGGQREKPAWVMPGEFSSVGLHLEVNLDDRGVRRRWNSHR